MNQGETREEVQERLSKESTNPFDALKDEQEQKKQDDLLAQDIIQSGLLFTKKGRTALGIKLQPFKREYPKVGRNTECQCGSGKKNKKCCNL